MNLTELHRYIEFSINASSKSGLTRQQMETICGKVKDKRNLLIHESHPAMSARYGMGWVRAAL